MLTDQKVWLHSDKPQNRQTTIRTYYEIRSDSVENNSFRKVIIILLRNIYCYLFEVPTYVANGDDAISQSESYETWDLGAELELKKVRN